jgi:hypothetical protein
VDNITKVLKGFVIAGGIALVAGTLLLVVLIVMRASENRPADPPEGLARTAEVPTGPCAAGPANAEPLPVPLPPGSRIEQVVPDRGCLILLGVDGAGRQFVALVDPRTGARISLLLLRPEP